MINTDESALICDFAETYQIYDYRSLPVFLAAIFAVGLREDSRIKMKMAGTKVSLDTFISAMISDQLGHLIWMMSENGQKAKDKPQRLTNILLGVAQEKNKSDVLTFESPEAFEEARKRIVEGR